MNDIVVQFLSVLNSAWRRRGQALAVTWVVCIFGWGAVVLLPDQYESSTRVYVDTANILRPLLKGLAVENDLQAEVDLMQRTLMSRPNIEKVARLTDLDINATTPLEKEKLVTSMESKTKIVRVSTNLYSISYLHEDPEKARDVVQAFLTVFIEGNLGQSRRDMNTARRFIEIQLKEYEQKLEAAEQRLAKFKQENMHLLSGQSGYQQKLEQAQIRLASAEAEKRDAEMRQQSLRGELQNIPQFLPDQFSGGEFSGPPSDNFMRILELENTLADLLSRYTEKHPDVVVARRKLDALLAQQEEELKLKAQFEETSPAELNGSSGYSTPNTLYEQIKISRIQESANIAVLEQRIIQAKEGLNELESWAARVPLVEAELTKLNRDYDVLKKRYEELLGRREAEKISRARETQGEDIQFRVMDPPQVPASASGPHRFALFTLALFAGIGSGLAFAVLRGFLGGTISSVSQLKQHFSLPVLGSVSIFKSFGQRGLGSVKSLVFGTSSLGLLTIYGVLIFIEWRVGFGKLEWGDMISMIPGDWLAFSRVFLTRTA